MRGATRRGAGAHGDRDGHPACTVSDPDVCGARRSPAPGPDPGDYENPTPTGLANICIEECYNEGAEAPTERPVVISREDGSWAAFWITGDEFDDPTWVSCDVPNLITLDGIEIVLWPDAVFGRDVILSIAGVRPLGEE